MMGGPWPKQAASYSRAANFVKERRASVGSVLKKPTEGIAPTAAEASPVKSTARYGSRRAILPSVWPGHVDNAGFVAADIDLIAVLELNVDTRRWGVRHGPGYALINLPFNIANEHRVRDVPFAANDRRVKIVGESARARNGLKLPRGACMVQMAMGQDDLLEVGKTAPCIHRRGGDDVYLPSNSRVDKREALAVANEVGPNTALEVDAVDAGDDLQATAGRGRGRGC
jgi:hypothetical protein